MPIRLPLSSGTAKTKVMTPMSSVDAATPSQAPCLVPASSPQTLEQLRSLNQQLSAMNEALQARLEQQSAASKMVLNVLSRLPIATLLLDAQLNLRLFTPACQPLFNLRSTDIGRPMADLRPLPTDPDLLDDADTVMHTGTPAEREVESRTGESFLRQISAYLDEDGAVDGVLITFIAIGEKKQLAQALQAETQKAELAAVRQSRFLASTSHDLRQPLQTLKLLQGLLLGMLDEEQPRRLTVRIGETVGAMSGLLNAILDINHIETGEIRVNPVSFRMSDLLDRLADEFSYKAGAKGLKLKLVPCRLSVESDPRLLEQVLRNLLSNALNHTHEGRILLGCRRHGGWLSIGVWDTGVGMEPAALQLRLNGTDPSLNPGQEPGQGLPIVQYLCALLGHQLRGHSQVAKGTALFVDVALAPEIATPQEAPAHALQTNHEQPHSGLILLVEDDLEVLDLLGTQLKSQGYQVVMASDAEHAFQSIRQGGVQPDLIFADYNLPGPINGLQVIVQLREQLHRRIPAVILTGDISRQLSHDVAFEGCIKLNKPAKLNEISFVVASLLARQQVHNSPLITPVADAARVFVIDEDPLFRATVRCVLEPYGYAVLDYPKVKAFLQDYLPGQLACLLVGAHNGLELLHRFKANDDPLALIITSNSGEVSIAVEAMKAGAADFIEKPLVRCQLLHSVARALEHSHDANKRRAWTEQAVQCIEGLTQRQRQIMELVLAGHPSKNIAAELGISQRTVENHRASIMNRTHCKSIPALARVALAASSRGLS
ncbi:response regulator [Pseudomonas sp. LD120]|nr:response regulator [Pseudomonas sp. LD120]